MVIDFVQLKVSSLLFLSILRIMFARSIDRRERSASECISPVSIIHLHESFIHIHGANTVLLATLLATRIPQKLDIFIKPIRTIAVTVTVTIVGCLLGCICDCHSMFMPLVKCNVHGDQVWQHHALSNDTLMICRLYHHVEKTRSRP
jgi:uncharacterized membrane protein